MAIDELGAELSRRSEQKGIDRREEDRRRRRKDMLRQFAGQAVMGGVKNFMETRQAKNAFNFMQREPIIAARAKFNQAVDAGIQQRQNWAESSSHAGGHKGWWFDKLQPEFRTKLLETIDEKDYTKDGFDSLVRQETNKYIDEVALPAYMKANDAANRMTADKTAFDKYIELNDGIPDSAIGTVFKGIGNVFRGKDEVALKQQARAAALAESDFVNKADAMLLAQQAMNKGYNVKEANEYAKMLDQYLITDQDYDEIDREDDIKTIYKNGRQTSVEVTKITKEDDHGRKRVSIEAKNPEDAAILKDNMDFTTEAKQVTRLGMIQNEIMKTIYDKSSGQIIGAKPEYTYIGLAPGGITSVTDSEADDLSLQFRNGYKTLTTVVGGDEKLHEDYDNFLGEYLAIAGKDDMSSAEYTASVRAFHKSIIYNGAIIENTFKASSYETNDDMLSQLISRNIVFNDMRRVANPGNVWDNIELGRSALKSSPSPLEILEALGTVQETNKTATIAKSYIKRIANSKELMQEFQNSDKRRLDILLDSFTSYQNIPEYSHLFDKSMHINPQDNATYSVFDLLQYAASRK